MGFPNLKNKHEQAPLVSPGDFLKYLKKAGRYPAFRPPRAMLLCYQRSLLKYVVKNHKTTRAAGICDAMYLLDETGGRVAIAGNFGIGAPAAVATLEELIAFGVKRFISVGTAGALRKGLKIGDLMVCEKAIRDEGTSYHYSGPSKYAYPSPKITAQIKAALDRQGRRYFSGVTWTIDAPYRETVAEIKKYQKEGVATVDMEASALFVVAACRRAQLGALFTISDSLAELEWNPQFLSRKTKKGLETIYLAALAAFGEQGL
jgi:uridine phosphorylase